MKWVQVSIETSAMAEDAISNLLMEMDSGGVYIKEDKLNSDRILVFAYFPPDDIIGERVSKINEYLENMRKIGINTGKSKVTIKQVDDEQWSESWKKFFKPLKIGKRIIVYPSWEDISNYQSRDILIEIDPGMAFGTGGHSTTKLCLEILEEIIKGGEIVADIGTGSGILAIGAVKLGASSVTAVDVDEKAIKIAKENLIKNKTIDAVKLLHRDLLSCSDDKYDIIISNISRQASLSIIPMAKELMLENGKIVLSGILRREAKEVHKSLESNNFNILNTTYDKEWSCILAGI
ncbi:50S ribosomal protein L11 methyltransferase [Candidatus Poribacteria bacterium]|nr:50S ribosomal protein L11 methyltransferase [Candidatus Poribacteria bacterium]